MAGNRQGGLKAAKTNKQRYGTNFYERIEDRRQKEYGRRFREKPRAGKDCRQKRRQGKPKKEKSRPLI